MNTHYVMQICSLFREAFYYFGFRQLKVAEIGRRAGAKKHKKVRAAARKRSAER